MAFQDIHRKYLFIIHGHPPTMTPKSVGYYTNVRPYSDPSTTVHPLLPLARVPINDRYASRELSCVVAADRQALWSDHLRLSPTLCHVGGTLAKWLQTNGRPTPLYIAKTLLIISE